MKIVFKEWLKDKRAFAMLSLSVMISIVYSVIYSYMIIAIRNVFDNPSDTWRVILVLGVLGSTVIIGPLKTLTERYAVQHNLREMSKRWQGKMVESDFQMFTKYSCSKIYTVGEFLWNCSTIMKQVMYSLSHIINMITTLVGMYILAGNKIMLVLLSYIIFAIILKILYNRYDVVDKKLTEIRKKRNQHLENSINGFAEIRAFGDQQNQISIHQELADNTFTFTMDRSKVSGSIQFVYELSDLAGVMIVMLFSLGQINAGLMSAATAVSLILYTFKLIDPIATILDIADSISSNKYLAKDYEEIMNYVNTLESGEIVLNEFNNEIRIKNLDFSYGDSDTVLHDINMKIRKGEHIGICGSSGNGKSTLAKLLLHFYDPKNGSIKIDGINLKEVTDKSFRNLVGTVQQENTIFPGSIMDNIVFGNAHAIEHEVVEACKKAKIYDFIMSLPEKFDTEVGPRGLKLSGGQKQRIALARLFLKNPQIIILDEATSALDNETETFVQEAIDSMSDKTVIIIAHRLSTIKNCDKIFVLDHGTVAESGSHEELINKNGIYTRMQK